MSYPTLKDGSRNWCATCKHNGEECEYGEECSYQQNFDGTFNRDLKPTHYDDKPQTNADRIKAMSDEELAEWILREPTIGYFAVCPPGTKDGEDCPTSPCEQCWLDWLKSPVEEVDNG